MIKKNKILFGVAVLLIIGLGGFFTYDKLNDSTTIPTAPKEEQKINYEPPTDTEKQETQTNKDEIVQDQQNTTNPTGKKQVNVTITNATTSNVSAYVTGIFEEGGTCTATFTQGSTTITRTSLGFQNASYTQCAPITPDLPSGDSWSVVVSYSSPAAEGQSAAKTF